MVGWYEPNSHEAGVILDSALFPQNIPRDKDALSLFNEFIPSLSSEELHKVAFNKNQTDYMI